MYPFHHQGEYLIHGLLLLKYLPLISDHQFETESIQFENEWSLELSDFW